ncbi:hypothetical protein [Streptomyces sp. NPDC001286]
MSVFEIRVICEPGDADRIGQTLAAAFDTGPVRQYPTRDRKRTRLYFTAIHCTSGTPHTESE